MWKFQITKATNDTGGVRIEYNLLTPESNLYIQKSMLINTTGFGEMTIQQKFQDVKNQISLDAESDIALRVEGRNLSDLIGKIINI